jgi:hypothetical protein
MRKLCISMIGFGRKISCIMNFQALILINKCHLDSPETEEMPWSFHESLPDLLNKLNLCISNLVKNVKFSCLFSNV